MLTVQVKKCDIYRGREYANTTCGCPIWRALRRTLNSLGEFTDLDKNLKVPHVYEARMPGWVIDLPDEAQDFQLALMKDVSAEVEPFEFEADVKLARRRK